MFVCNVLMKSRHFIAHDHMHAFTTRLGTCAGDHFSINPLLKSETKRQIEDLVETLFVYKIKIDFHS